MKILVVAGEAPAKAARLAVKLAKPWRGKVVFMYVLEKGLVEGRRACVDALVPASEGVQVRAPLSDLLRRLTIEAMEQLEKCMELAKREGVEAEVLICEGELEELVVSESRKGYDLLLLRFSGFDKRMKKIVEKVEVPVLLVKDFLNSKATLYDLRAA